MRILLLLAITVLLPLLLVSKISLKGLDYRLLKLKKEYLKTMLKRDREISTLKE